MSKISRSKAKRLVAQFRKAYPDIFETWKAVGESRKLTKREEDMRKARLDGYGEGWREGKSQGEEALKKAQADLQNRRKELHLDVLKTMNDNFRMFGQMMGELSRALQSEKDQL